MTVRDFARVITQREKGKVQVNIAQVMEILKIEKDLLLPFGLNLYQLIGCVRLKKKKQDK